MKKLLILLCASITLSFTAFADTGNAGCGLGYVVFSGSHGLIQQLVSATLNGTSINQSFAMTFGTSGCASMSGIVSVDKQETTFVAQNNEVLSEQMSQGKGETLAAYGEVLGCSAASINAFNKATQAHYNEIFTANAKTAQAILANTHKVIANNANLAQSCVKAS